MNQFTQEELKNVLALLARVELRGNEAFAVAMLQKKVQSLITEVVAPLPTKSDETKTAN